MKVWIEIDSTTPFKVGDVIADKNEIVASHDGDRGIFREYRRLLLRPVENDSIYAMRKLISEKPQIFANNILA